MAAILQPLKKMGTTEWAETFRGMSAKSTALPGRYNASLTPWVPGIHQALDDPAVRKVVAQKSAQVAWTDGVLLNYLGRRIDIDPLPDDRDVRKGQCGQGIQRRKTDADD